MFKKLAAVLVLLLGSYTTTYAGLQIYIAPGLSYIDVHNNSNELTFQGLDPRFAVGVGTLTLGMFYFALEAFANPIHPMTINSQANELGQNIKPSYSYGASLLPGFHLDDVISLYARAGIIYTRFGQLHTTQGGLQLGVGIETIFGGPWSGRIEYTRSLWRHYDGIDNMYANVGTASLLYYFC
ncbi:MAG: hypothetical protein H0W64_07265 [Gammaproteobacteria bacterium]|nr:hypothetical protein [Gammaproteobacteria bacterium]